MQSDNDGDFPPIMTLSASIQNFSNIINAMIDRSIDDMYMQMAMNQSLIESVNQRKDTIKIKTSCVKFSEVKNEDNKKCMVCLLEFDDDDDVQCLECKHVFHHKCLDEWVKYKPECPTCRSQIETETCVSETDEAISMRSPISLTIECDECGESFNEEDFLEHECHVEESKEVSEDEM